MFKNRLFVSLAVLSMCYSSIAYSLELAGAKVASQANFVSIQNTTPSSISITFSNGKSAELQESTGKLFPCADIQGIAMFVSVESGISKLSGNILCGHSYSVKENAE